MIQMWKSSKDRGRKIQEIPLPKPKIPETEKARLDSRGHLQEVVALCAGAGVVSPLSGSSDCGCRIFLIKIAKCFHSFMEMEMIKMEMFNIYIAHLSI